MKTSIFIFAMNLLMTSVIFGQEREFVLTNKRTHHVRTLSQGKKVRIITLEGNKLRGKLNLINDSTFSLNGDTLSLSEIEKIRAKTLFSKITGGTITTGGAGFITLGSLLVLETQHAGGFDYFFGLVLGIPTITAGVLIATSGTLILVSGKNYKKGKWDYRIKLKSVR